jgi:hypothetical protein
LSSRLSKAVWRTIFLEGGDVQASVDEITLSGYAVRKRACEDPK